MSELARFTGSAFGNTEDKAPESSELSTVSDETVKERCERGTVEG